MIIKKSEKKVSNFRAFTDDTIVRESAKRRRIGGKNLYETNVKLSNRIGFYRRIERDRLNKIWYSFIFFLEFEASYEFIASLRHLNRMWIYSLFDSLNRFSAHPAFFIHLSHFYVFFVVFLPHIKLCEDIELNENERRPPNMFILFAQSISSISLETFNKGQQKKILSV